MTRGAELGAARRLLPESGHLPALDVLGRLAAKLLGVRSAQVSLLTDVQTVAGGEGLPVGALGSQGPLADSLCTVTAAEGRPLVVAEATGDARVAALPPVASGLVGSYLGVPLLLGDGTIVGALCVFDADPHPWSEADADLLAQLAEWAVTELELAALGREHEDAHARWELAIDAAGIGSFDWDLETGALAWDDRLMDLFGYDRASFGGHIDAFNVRVHPDDVPRVAQAIDEAIASVGTLDVEYRVRPEPGVTRWVRARGRVITDADGTPRRMVGAAQDTTEGRDLDLRVSRALEAMAAGVVLLAKDWRVTYVNGAAERFLGMSRDQMLGRDHWELFPDAVGTIWEETYRGVVATGEPETVEAYYGPPVDAWLDVRVSPAPDGLILSFQDVTARHEAEELVRLSTTVAEQLVAAREVDVAVGELARLVVPRLADWSIVSLVEGDGTTRTASSWHADPAKRPLVARYAELGQTAIARGGAAQKAAETRSPVLIEHGAMEAARAVMTTPELTEILTALHPESVAVVPLNADGRLLGLLILCRTPERAPITPGELAVAESIAGRAALALDNARLYAEQRAVAERLQRANRRLLAVAEHERTVAQALQEAMLTHLPEPDHLHLVARYRTASADEQVGGDWYDAVVLPTGATALMIGDVIGHDISAAAVMGQLRNMLRTLAWDRDEPPSATVARLDRAIRDLRIDTFATLLVLRIEQDDDDRAAGMRTLRWTSAGHPAPLLLHADGSAELLDEPTDVLLGIAPESPRRDHVHKAPPGSTLLLYTDGLVETRTEEVVDGQRRLADTLRAHRDLDPEALLDAVLAEMVGGDPEDDVALLAVRFHDERVPRPAEAGPEHR